MVFKDESLEGKSDLDEAMKVLMMGPVSLTEEVPESLFSLILHHWRTQREGSHL